MQVSKTRLKIFIQWSLMPKSSSILKEIMLMKLNEFLTKAIFETAPKLPSIYLTGIFLQTYSNSKPRMILGLNPIWTGLFANLKDLAGILSPPPPSPS